MTNVLKAYRWRGVDRVYTLPWLRRNVEITGEPARIEQFARTPFTRSTTLMKLLSTFHLSSDSILVSSDAHSAYLRTKLIKRFPAAMDYPPIARAFVTRLFDPARFPAGQRGPSGAVEAEHDLSLSGEAVRQLYLTLLKTMLGVRVQPPLRDFIERTDFSPGWRPLRFEAFLYSLRLHLPVFAPLRWVLDLGLFRGARRMRRISRELERLVCAYSQPLEGSWFSALQAERAAGRITPAQFRGEITAILVSSFSLASTLSFCLLCLAASPYHVGRIRHDPDFAKHFLSEVLRLYPPFHQFGYEAMADGRAGNTMGATSEFLISALFLHRNPETWDMPDHFRPERFEDSIKQHRFQYLPFGMGARLCPGRSYSLRLLGEVVKFVCSDAAPMRLVPSSGMPRARADRIISFPVDDRLRFTTVPA